jgi:iron complex outermembrane receptor protein
MIHIGRLIARRPSSNTGWPARGGDVVPRTRTPPRTGAITGAILSSLGIQAIHAQSSASQLEASRLEEVVVTARKTEESLQRVPVSVSAISGEELAQRSLDNLSAVGQSTPNFLFGERGASGRGSGVIFIRGVGQTDVRPTYDPAVGVYVDGVFLGRMQGNNLNTMDLERLEVLRGPQGTLFGKNTSGGAVNIVTRQPDLSDFFGKVQLVGGSRDRFDALGNVNVPLSDGKAALLLSASRRKQDGYGSRADGQNMGSTDRTSGRVSLRWKLTDQLSALFAADGETYDETNSVFKLISVYPAAPPIAALNAFTPLKYDSRWLSTSDFSNFAGGPNSSRGDLSGASLTFDYETGPVTLKSISAYRRNTVHSDQDADLSPITILDEYDASWQDQYSQELQASGESFGDRLAWVAGLYYFHEAIRNKVDFPLVTPLFGFSRSFSNDHDVTNESVAAYGQGNYSLTDELRLTAGVRYTHDEKEVKRRNLAYPSGTLLEPELTKSSGSNDVSPRVGLDYQWTDTVMTYVSAAKGYKAGGFNGRASNNAGFNEYEPEKVLTYELGLRSDLLNRRLRFNATAFYSDYSDLQLQISGSTTVNGAPAPFNIVSNVPKARITGGELELEVLPTDGLKLSTHLGITDAKYTDLPTSAQFTAARLITENSRFVYTPKTSASVAAEYATLVTDGVLATGRVDYAYKSTIHYDLANSPLLRQKPYGLLNARLTFEHQSKGWALSLFGTNLTNRHYIIGGFDDADTPNPGLGFAFVNMAPPREWGVSAQWRF